MAPPDPSSLTAIATEILAQAQALDGAAASRGLPAPSLDRWTLSELSLKEEECRKKVIDGCHKLKQLASGPVGQFYDVCFNPLTQFTDSLSLRFLHENAIAKYIPDHGAITLASLAVATHQDEVFLRRFLHHAMTNGFTQEAPPGYISHTAASRLWKQDDGLRDTIGFLLDDIAPGSRFVLQAHVKWPGSAEPNETGFNIAEGTSDPFYLHLAKDKERSRRFGNGMRFFAHADQYAFDIRHLIDGYPWSSTVDRPGAVFVDVGGGHGTVSRALHDSTQHLRFVVQDLPGTVSEGQASLPASYSRRISFMAHDFLTPQPVPAADVYFFRWILHNWADAYAEKLLRHVVAVMKPGSKILIQEQMPDAVSDTRWSGKSKYNLDMIQATGWNSLERTLPDWEALFKRVDPRLFFCGAQTPKGSLLTLIEAEWMDVP